MDFGLADQDAGTGGSLRLPTLPPFLRVLLVTDGTVTKSLEAYFQEGIDVEVLLHTDVSSDRSYPEIEVAPADPIVKRRVILRGTLTRSAYAFAETIIATDRIAPEVRRRLAAGRKGIGEVLREGKLETYRELIGIRRADAGEWAVHLGVDRGSGVMIRNYKIYHLGRAAIRIEEVFPVSPFQSATG